MNDAIKEVELKITGRSGELIYHNGSRAVSVYVEMSGTSDFDLLVSTGEIQNWSDSSPVTNKDKEEIMQSFANWSNRRTLNVSGN